MKTKLALALAGTALAVAALAGCSSPAAPTADAPSAPAAPQSSAKDVSLATSSYGQIVVDGKGMTAYFYDNDTANAGTSTCTGACATMWPAITATSAAPTVDGVTGAVATIPASDGGFQITIEGHPIYTFANDKAAGDVNGQGVGGVWYVIDATGAEVKTSPKGY